MPFRKPKNKAFEPVGRVPEETVLHIDPFDGTSTAVSVDPYEKLPPAVELKDLLKAGVNIKEVDSRFIGVGGTLSAPVKKVEVEKEVTDGE